MFKLSTIHAKLVFLVSVMSVCMVVIGLIGLSGTSRANSGMQEMYQNNLVPMIQIATLRGDINTILRELAFAAIHDPTNPVSSLHDHPVSMHIDSVDKSLAELGATWKEYAKLIDSPEEKKLADAFNESRTIFLEKTVVPALGLLKQGKYQEVNALIFKGGTAQAKQAAGDTQRLLEYQLKQSKDAGEVNQAYYRRQVLISAISIGVGLLIALGIGYLITRSITASTRSLMVTADRIENGDLTARSNLSGDDEMSRVASSFDRIAATFTKSINELAALGAEVTAAASKVHMASEELSEGVQQVAVEATTVATAGEEMAATSGDIACNCQMAAESSHQATGQASDGAAIIQSSITVMQKIAEQVRDSARTVEGLGQRSDQIGQIIGTIEDIADQTNLLALNAAIEAARAGEMGRGFAVVADEVRALAERTTRATREIAQMIKTIQSETRTAVTAMEEGVTQVQQGSHEAARSGEVIEGILGQISSLSMQISQIATAAEQQTATTSEISGNMLHITDVVGQSSRNAHDSAMEASHLNLLAETLMNTLNQFTVDEPVNLSLKKAKSAHMIFTGKIRSHLNDAMTVDPNTLSTHLTCAFGKWCQDAGKKSCGHLPIFNEIDVPHAKVHDLGKQALLAYNAGDRSCAFQLCNEMQAQSDRLMDILDRMMGESATLMTWGSQFSVNIRQFDDQHKRLIEIVNQLNDAMANGKGHGALKTILDSLIQYTVTHFADEEKLMAQHQYPELEQHKKLHEELKKTAVELQKKFLGNSSALSSEVMNFLRNWLVNHIQGVDKKYGVYLNSKGIR
jgi:hemerythrin-like metal-binding protein